MENYKAKLFKAAVRRLPNFLIANKRLKRAVSSAINQVEFEYFVRSNPTSNFCDRYKLFDHVITSIDSPYNYLEFGVYKGESISYFASKTPSNESTFTGFDSFEGLPEEWAHVRKGGFDTGGAIPTIDDPRVKFIKGFFNLTVPNFELKNKDLPLVVHLDADLYSSTMFVLVTLDKYLKEGTYLLFDEFYDRDHEFRALLEYLRISQKNIKSIGEVDRFGKICVQLI